MYEELGKRLRKRAVNLKEKFTKNAELLAELTEAADAIEELQYDLDIAVRAEAAATEACKPRWIPVTERLPEKRKWVLCRCEANIIEVLRWENNEWYHDPMHVYYPSFVTHWMPLPEPPKEEA